MRKYRCPWCGEETIKYPTGKYMSEGIEFYPKCRQCNKEHSAAWHRRGLAKIVNIIMTIGVLVFLIVVFILENLTTIPLENGLLPLIAFALMLVSYLVNLFAGFSNVLIIKIYNDKIVPFTSQARIIMTLANDTKRINYLIKQGSILDARFPRIKGVYRESDRGDNIQAFCMVTCLRDGNKAEAEISMIQSAIDLKANMEFTVIDKGKDIAQGKIIKLLEKEEQTNWPADE